MPRKPYKYHYLYKTTNVINNKFYVGMHSTDDLNDGYLGSGKYLRRSINKYGRENFNIEFLEFFDDRKKLAEREENIVNEEFLKDPLCMNLTIGGKGGGGETLKKLWQDPEFRKRNKQRAIDRVKWLKPNRPNWTGKKHKAESKKKIAKSNSGILSSSYKTYWIYNKELNKNKRIKEEDLEKYLTNSWIMGRGKTYWIYNKELNKNKRIKEEDLEKYLNQSWIKGRIN